MESEHIFGMYWPNLVPWSDTERYGPTLSRAAPESDIFRFPGNLDRPDDLQYYWRICQVECVHQHMIPRIQDLGCALVSWAISALELG